MPVAIMEVTLGDTRWHMESPSWNLKNIVLDKKYKRDNKIFIPINIYAFQLEKQVKELALTFKHIF